MQSMFSDRKEIKLVIHNRKIPGKYPRVRRLTVYLQRQKKQEELQSCSLWNEKHIHRKIDKMKSQRTMYQMKEQDKTPEKQLNEVEIGNLPEKNSE